MLMKNYVTYMGGRSMRNIRSSYSFSKVAIGYESESVINVHSHELASKSPHVVSSSFDHDLNVSVDFSSSAYKVIYQESYNASPILMTLNNKFILLIMRWMTNHVKVF